ncbi:hypothetical protein [Pseudomonas huaxiensis]|uniref:hypothetical protein n=1 Tax=Pseudomonas huaxiensis TaxID=2213017 RepID=UPI000DA64FA6|nr:hypothetical protein [Pseudomonas huaxiensis]
MSDSIQRFARRQALRNSNSERPLLVAMPSSADALRLDAASADLGYLESMAILPPVLPVKAEVPDVLVDARLAGLIDAFDSQRVERLFAEMRQTSLQSIAGPFGVGKMLSAYDKAGGTVDTIHNARKGVYATDAAEQVCTKDDPYTEAAKASYHQKNKAYMKASQDSTDERVKGNLKDAYTDETMSSRRSDSHSMDHVIAAEEIHNDRGRKLAGVDGATAANKDSNLKPTSITTNSAMGKKTATEYVAWLEETKSDRAKSLKTLREQEASGEPMSQKARQKLAKLEEQEKIAANPELLLEADRQARAEYEKTVNDAYYRSPKFRQDCLRTSALAGGRMAFQAAMGAILVELFAGIFDELKDWYRNGSAQESTIGTELKHRLKRVGVRVARQWKGVLAAAAGGFVSGFLANLVTVLVNAFLTTAKRTIRMIREGAGSLVKACKTLLVRPEGMSLDEGLHEASKVLVGGAIIVGGVVLEEAVSKYLMVVPFIAPFADLATAVIVGTVTAVTSTLAVYLVDKADVFGVNRARMLEQINVELDVTLQRQHDHQAGLIQQWKALNI